MRPRAGCSAPEAAPEQADTIAVDLRPGGQRRKLCPAPGCLGIRGPPDHRVGQTGGYCCITTSEAGNPDNIFPAAASDAPEGNVALELIALCRRDSLSAAAYDDLRP